MMVTLVCRPRIQRDRVTGDAGEAPRIVLQRVAADGAGNRQAGEGREPGSAGRGRRVGESTGAGREAGRNRCAGLTHAVPRRILDLDSRLYHDRDPALGRAGRLTVHAQLGRRTRCVSAMVVEVAPVRPVASKDGV